MIDSSRMRFVLFASLCLSIVPAVCAQAPAAPTAILGQIHLEGLKNLPEAQIIAISELHTGTPVAKADLQAAADRLLKTGLFAKVNYKYETRDEELSVTFQIQEAPLVPVYYDNLPWFADSELNDAIRAKLPYFDGKLPEGGAALDIAASAVNELLASRNLNVTADHQLIANPDGDGDVQDFHVQEVSFHIGTVQFADPALNASHVLQQALSAVVGKPYSRMTIDLFLAEQVLPLYLQRGYLRVKLGPPSIRLAGNPNQKLPDELPIFIPVDVGAVYYWKDPEWSGNSLLSSITLSNAIGLKPGDVADGMKLESGWDRVREEYGHRGFLDAKLNPVVSYDDKAHTVSYAVSVSEGEAYNYNAMVLTGLSLEAEKLLLQKWPIQKGAAFDKSLYEKFLTALETRPSAVFGELPLHYDKVGHWLRTDPGKHEVDVLLDFQ